MQDMLGIIPLIMFSLTLHEYAHARVALAFGDDTARSQGRCSFNPLVHIDPFGTLALFITQMFGWARPVPVNPANLSPRRMGSISVSLAGPLTNLALSIISICALKLVGPQVPGTWMALVQRLLWINMAMNAGLFVFNLIPLFPLDGHHIMRELLPPEYRYGFMAWQMRYGTYALIGLIFLLAMSSFSLGGWVITIMGKVFGV